MGERILVMGRSGSGKSRSLVNLNEKETVINRIVKKPLPFKGWKSKYQPFDKETKVGNLFDVRVAGDIIKLMDYVDGQMKHVKYLVMDDIGLMMHLELFDKASERGYDKFTIAAKNLKEVLMKPEELREDLTVIYMFHVETSGFNGADILKAKTAGKMIDSQLGVESLFTYVLLADVIKKGKDEVEHVFITQTDGTTTAKTPEDMFEGKYIPNDLDYVIKSIVEYNK